MAVWALAVVCVVQAGVLAYAFRAFSRTVRESEQTHALERAALLNRIQAPEQAVAQALAPDSDLDEPAVHPDLPEDYWEAIESVEEMERT